MQASRGTTRMQRTHLGGMPRQLSACCTHVCMHRLRTYLQSPSEPDRTAPVLEACPRHAHATRCTQLLHYDSRACCVIRRCVFLSLHLRSLGSDGCNAPALAQTIWLTWRRKRRAWRRRIRTWRAVAVPTSELTQLRAAPVAEVGTFMTAAAVEVDALIAATTPQLAHTLHPLPHKAKPGPAIGGRARSWAGATLATLWGHDPHC